jgi:two-component system response regulator ResD
MKKKILVIDDEAGLRNFFATFFARKGFETLKAETGEKGIELARQYPDIILVLSDIDMPGMPGYEAVAQIRTILNGQTRYVLMSGESHSAEEIGVADEFFMKPISLATLVDLVAKL